MGFPAKEIEIKDFSQKKILKQPSFSHSEKKRAWRNKKLK